MGPSPVFLECPLPFRAEGCSSRLGRVLPQRLQESFMPSSGPVQQDWEGPAGHLGSVL